MRIAITAIVAIAVSTGAQSTFAAKNDEHSLDVKTRLIHFDRDFENDAADREQTALGFEANYVSPQYNDLIGFGVSGYIVQDIGDSGAVREDILTVDDGQAEGFGLIGQAFLKLTPVDGLALKLGRQKHKSMLLLSSGSRAVPNTFQGVSAQYKTGSGLKLYAAVYDEWSRRARDDFEDFVTDNGDKIDFVGLVGAKYKTKKFSFEAEFLHSDDFLSKYGIRSSYKIPLEASSLKVTGGIFGSYDDGSLFTVGSEALLDDEDGSTGNDAVGVYAELAWKKGNFELSGALAQFDGLWIEDNFNADHGRNPFPTRSSIGPDLTNDGETVASLKFKYNWKDSIPGLVTTLSFGAGRDAENTTNAALGTADEDWQQLDVKYKVPGVKGLKLRGIWHNYDSSEVGAVDGVGGDIEDIRLYADYTHKF